jgi:hypothetical protein
MATWRQQRRIAASSRATRADAAVPPPTRAGDRDRRCAQLVELKQFG